MKLQLSLWVWVLCCVVFNYQIVAAPIGPEGVKNQCDGWATTQEEVRANHGNIFRVELAKNKGKIAKPPQAGMPPTCEFVVLTPLIVSNVSYDLCSTNLRVTPILDDNPECHRSELVTVDWPCGCTSTPEGAEKEFIESHFKETIVKARDENIYLRFMRVFGDHDLTFLRRKYIQHFESPIFFEIILEKDLLVIDGPKTHIEL